MILTVTTSALSLGSVAAQADSPGASRVPPQASSTRAIVSGTVVSVNTSAGTFVANAYLRSPATDHSADPTSTQVTIITNSSTRFNVDGDDQATIGDLAGGQTFYAAFNGDPGQGLATLIAGPADAVFAFAPPTEKVYMAGTIVSASATPGTSTGTFVADAYLLQAPRHRGRSHHPSPGDSGWAGANGGPAATGWGANGYGWRDAEPFGNDMWSEATTAPAETQVTITTNPSTEFKVDGNDKADLGELASGQSFVASFIGSPSDSITELTANPALRVIAWTPPTRSTPPAQPPAATTLYAFVGTVTDVSTSADTVTVEVSESLPSGLVPSGSTPQTFTIGTGTLILGAGGTSLLNGTLADDVARGDVVAGGLLRAAGLTLSQVGSTPLRVLVAFPAAATSSTSTAQARKSALNQAVSLLSEKHGKPIKQAGKGRKDTKSHKDTSKKGKHGKGARARGARV